MRPGVSARDSPSAHRPCAARSPPYPAPLRFPSSSFLPQLPIRPLAVCLRSGCGSLVGLVGTADLARCPARCSAPRAAPEPSSLLLVVLLLLLGAFALAQRLVGELAKWGRVAVEMPASRQGFWTDSVPADDASDDDEA